MYERYLRCFDCGERYNIEELIYECECGGSLEIEYDYNLIKKKIKEISKNFYSSPPSQWKYWMFYPIKNLKKIITMGEGGTPLIPSVKKEDWLFKYEGTNPTGSFKDRGSTIEITKAVEKNVREVWCATTGNMGASIAAYCARAGIKANIVIPSHTYLSKIKQILSYGAHVKKIKGSYDDCVLFTKNLLEKRKAGRANEFYLVGDYAFRGEGEKGDGFEIIDQLSYVPDYIVMPVGNGTNLYGTYKAMVELKILGMIKKLPKFVGVQASGSAPIYNAWKEGINEIEPVKPKTIASAIEVGNPIDGKKALKAVRKSGGIFEAVTDAEIKRAQKYLAREEGIYAEAGAAASYAAAEKLELNGKTVIIITGHGLKEK